MTDPMTSLPLGTTPVVLMRFGSHLYGTATPQSDTDWKGVFIPSSRDILLGRIPKAVQMSTGPKDSKNSAGDVDVEWYSLHYFLKLAAEGQTVAMDMLHAPDNWPHASSKEWRYLRTYRREFHTRNLQAFVGYCRRQAAKYGVKGSRLDAVKVAMGIVYAVHETGVKLADIIDRFPLNENIDIHVDLDGRRFLRVCGRSLQDTISLGEAYDVLDHFAKEYGDRARQARDNAGIDWKAVSHAMRAAMELLEIYRDGDISFPLEGAEELTAVKLGMLDYTTAVAPRLEELMAEVESESLKSGLPKEVDRARWDEWLADIVAERLISEELA